jgi:hypothetical protein
MKEKKIDLVEYAKRIDAFSPKKKEVNKILLNRLRGTRLSSVSSLIDKKKKTATSSPFLKTAQRMQIEEFDPKKISFVKSAYSAYKCCQNQDLHLFQLQKIYIEKKHPLKGIIGWRFPKKKTIEEQLKSFVESLKPGSDSYKKHTVTWILKLEKAESEKTFQSQVELHRHRKDNQNYQINRPIF